MNTNYIYIYKKDKFKFCVHVTWSFSYVLCPEGYEKPWFDCSFMYILDSEWNFYLLHTNI